MAGKFITLDEAAEQLGISPEELNELRQRQELNGYRDGASWKFKTEDVSQLAERRGSGGSSNARELGPSDSQEMSELPDLDLPISLEGMEDSSEDVVLLSEFELGESGPSTSSTIIGRVGAPLSPMESDIKVVSTADQQGAGASSTSLGVPGQMQPGESAIKLETPESHAATASSTTIGKPGQPLGADESAVKVRTTDADLASPSSTVIGKPGGPMGAAESEVKIRAFEEDIFGGDLELPIGGDKAAGSGIDLQLAPSGSAVRLEPDKPADIVVDSGISLEESSEDDFVLSGMGSDITISPGDSGISLVDPSDSGLSLDVPPELRATSAEGFELAESGSEIGAITDFDSDEVMELKTDDEFLLTPMSSEGEESDDSGSQVIALDSDTPFEASDSMFAEEGGVGTMLEEDVSVVSAGGMAEGFAGATPVMAGAFATAPAMSLEQPYPAWVVALLTLCVLVLTFCGMFMYDLVRNMWSWNAPYRVNSSIMDAILGLFGG